MATLRHLQSRALCGLEAEHLVGRSTRAALHLDQTYVSAQHASLRWTSGAWDLKDLGSRNGTFLNDAVIAPGKPFRLKKGDRISFGRAEQTWELEDDSPPQVMVVPLDGSHGPLFVEGDILALPSQEDPRATVFHGSDGRWHLEQEDEIVPLSTRQVFEVAGRRFRFSFPNHLAQTSTIDWPERGLVSLELAHLLFRVSKDEEHVELRVQIGKQIQDLGSRGHNYLLLLLARQRLADATEGVADTACGWVYLDDFVESLGSATDRVNIDIFRIRRQFAGLASDAANIIERRPRTKQLRIGVRSFSIETI